jgi:hypothetical protein
MTCITRVKSAEVCKEVDDDSGIEFGEVDLRICLNAILTARYATLIDYTNYSPELKKEEWSVYVLDQTVAERKFSGNGTINSVIKDDEAVPVVGKVKKKFRRETLEIELRLVKVVFFWMWLIIGSYISGQEAARNIIRTSLAIRVPTTFYATTILPKTLIAPTPTTIITHATNATSFGTNPTTTYTPSIIFPSIHRPNVDRI